MIPIAAATQARFAQIHLNGLDQAAAWSARRSAGLVTTPLRSSYERPVCTQQKPALKRFEK